LLHASPSSTIIYTVHVALPASAALAAPQHGTYPPTHHPCHLPTGDFSAGIFKAIDLFNAGGGSKDTFFGVLCITNVAVWGLAGFGSWVVLGLAIKAFRASDGPRKEYEARHGGSGV
jgi:hypothetical protein